MLKKFFTVFLGSMAAIWLSILIFIGIILIAVFSMMFNFNQLELEPNSVLYVELYGEINDRYTPPTMDDMVMGFDPEAPTFDEVVQSIRLAKTDANIKGIYLNLRDASMGIAMREELRAALADFKKSGKWIVAYADNYNQGDFYTAAIADTRYINPSGRVTANGLAATVPFFKNALDKLGVEIQVIKVGTFKSAVEPYILTEMSDSARMMYDVLLNSMWDTYVSDVTNDLGWGRTARADSVFNQMASTPMNFYTAPQLIKANFFTDAKYAYEVKEIVKKRAGTDNDNFLVSPHQYLMTMPNVSLEEIMGEGDHIAVVYAVGDIVDSGEEDGYTIVGDRMAPMIAELADDESVKGIVLRINSGGGSAFASEQIWASLEYFKSKGKPFVVSMGDVAASGGYYIACGADKIYADRATMTGSIGIFGIIPYGKELLNDKLGIDFSVVQTNPNAAFPQLDAPLTPQQHAALENMIHDGYDLFVKRVSEGRNLTDAHVRRIAEGRVWSGTNAKEIGLVDAMGGLDDAIRYTASKAGISADKTRDYPQVQLTPLELLMSMNSTPQSKLISPDMKEGIRIFNRVRNMNTIQAKMEDIRVRM